MIPQKSAFTALRAAACLTAMAVSVVGCDQLRLPSRAGATPAQQAACHSRAEDIYAAQNKGDIYRSDTASTDSTSPFSTSSFANDRNDALSSQYSYQRNLDDCYTKGTDPSPATTTSKP